MISLLCGGLKKEKAQPIVTEGRMVVTKGQGMGGKGKLKKKKNQNDDSQGLEGGGPGKLLFNGNRVSVLQDEKSSGDGWR